MILALHQGLKPGICQLGSSRHSTYAGNHGCNCAVATASANPAAFGVFAIKHKAASTCSLALRGNPIPARSPTSTSIRVKRSSYSASASCRATRKVRAPPEASAPKKVSATEASISSAAAAAAAAAADAAAVATFAASTRMPIFGAIYFKQCKLSFVKNIPDCVQQVTRVLLFPDNFANLVVEHFCSHLENLDRRLLLSHKGYELG